MDTIAQKATRRVLVVEDDRGVMGMLRFALKRAGFEVTETTTGSNALAVMQKGGVDVVVLDLGLPDGLGGAVLQWLQEHGQPLPGGPDWVVITALDRQEAAKKYGPLGSNFLAKPFNPWELVSILNTLLEARRPSSDGRANHPGN